MEVFQLNRVRLKMSKQGNEERGAGKWSMNEKERKERVKERERYKNQVHNQRGLHWDHFKAAEAS